MPYWGLHTVPKFALAPCMGHNFITWGTDRPITFISDCLYNAIVGQHRSWSVGEMFVLLSELGNQTQEWSLLRPEGTEHGGTCWKFLRQWQNADRLIFTWPPNMPSMSHQTINQICFYKFSSFRNHSANILSSNHDSFSHKSAKPFSNRVNLGAG